MFQIPVKIPALEKRRKSIGLLHVVAGFFLFANIGSAYKVVAPETLKFVTPFYVAAFAFVVYGMARKKLDPSFQYNKVMRLLQALAFFIIAILFINKGVAAKSIGPFIWAALAAMLAVTEGIALSAPIISVNEKGIVFPGSFAQQQLAWQDISDVTLRPDFITIHRKDNKLLQLERILPAENDEAVQQFFQKHLQQAGATAGI